MTNAQKRAILISILKGIDEDAACRNLQRALCFGVKSAADGNAVPPLSSPPNGGDPQ